MREDALIVIARFSATFSKLLARACDMWSTGLAKRTFDIIAVLYRNYDCGKNHLTTMSIGERR